MYQTKRLNRTDKVIITAALTGAVTTKQDNPALPTQPEEIAKAAIRCWEAGAAVVHIHVRDDNDQGSMRFDKFQDTVGLIRQAKCPVVLNLTSSGGQGFSWEDRIKPFRELKPELASFDAGTMNWLNKVVFMNEPEFLERCGNAMIAAGVKPEIEVFDIGMLNTAKYYLKKGIIQAPAHFQLCLGAPGGMEATVENLLYLVNHLPENCTWGAFGIGRGANEVLLAALALGGNIRVGLEDNVYYNHGQLARSNEQFVERVKRVANEFGRQAATSDEAREILGITKNRQE
ncbi:3-keto-5-aminohexanoate cleavage protein [Flavonifractor sp. DFI.6.63]|uniref:3-keto-5-aminohexanoate cleavage protein n=1 Tax=Flavonifractor sp. DFI.6.63 TaxID=2963704 RepID=UPI00210E017D|nr:3-keto-5-aminohexanoate cleavage protein [Flavonifractor sp. DFI.6.63]MCQ5029198.1 3-keto-5-aminohexanoate cleavage protein [Flavonifractor sp. DFI.6.63]